MALAVAASRALAGLEAPPVTVEVHLANGLPGFNLVGLPDTEVKEARDRVRAALQTSGFEFPARRITVNLAPADLPKESGRFDLPIALGILAASGQLPRQALQAHEFAGELSLSGDLRPIRGALAMALQAADSGRTFLLPQASAAEAALSGHDRIIGCSSLLEACGHLRGERRLDPLPAVNPEAAPDFPDLSEVRGQEAAKRALEIAAAGQHSLLLSGPPGSGKSMLAARLPGLMPPLSRADALAAAATQSLAGQFRVDTFGQRPFRQPHHSASRVALVGGGTPPRPGEISLAHGGILFLDEFPEFQRSVLESLREPLETGRIHIARAGHQAEFPARFQLIAAMNPCPCGHLGNPAQACRCTPDQVRRYQARLSGPLLDRIDLFVEVPAQDSAALLARPAGERSANVRQRVAAAWARQTTRQGMANAHLPVALLDTHCTLDTTGERLLGQAVTRFGLSARACHRILRVARTIADLADQPQIGAAHLAEALHYRRAG